MFSITGIARLFLRRQASQASLYANPGGMEEVQLGVLQYLLRRAAKTRFGTEAGFRHLRSYADYASHVPVRDYEGLRPWVERMLDGEANVLWPGKVKNFAQSSGTSGSKSKYIPITSEGLHKNHYAGASRAVAHYLQNYPDSRIFDGKAFILGGSFANELDHCAKGIHVGDLSATLIDKVNPVVELMRVPSRKTALMENWEQKLPELARQASRANVTNISGVPSWFLTVLRRILALTGADELHQVWPDFEVFFHGGISFDPYRRQYDAIADPSRTRYVENYNASEGFFATQDNPEVRAMLLLADIGVFYEFLPIDADPADPFPRTLTAWQVEPGQVYSLIISSINGLWRYAIGDTVRIESVEPLRISIAGRTKAFINAFGEEVMVWNTDAALTAACRKTGADAADYTVAPVFTSSKSKGCHQWLIEWHTPPADIDRFARILDSELASLNSDYQAKRAGDIFLGLPKLTSVPAGTFDTWLAATGKLGGQRKVPRLANDRRVVESILNLINKNN